MRYNGLQERIITLQEIYRNWDQYEDQFDTYLLPPVREMDDGRQCIRNFVRVTDSTSGGQFVAFVLLDKNRKLIKESEYTFADLPKEGYLVRYSVPTRIASPDTLNLDYAIDINNINLVETMMEEENSSLQFVQAVPLNTIHHEADGTISIEDIIWDPIVGEFGKPDVNEIIFNRFFFDRIPSNGSHSAVTMAQL